MRTWMVATRKSVKRGDALFHTGDAFKSVYAVRTGFFKTRISSEDGRDQVTGFQMAGELLGLDPEQQPQVINWVGNLELDCQAPDMGPHLQPWSDYFDEGLESEADLRRVDDDRLADNAARIESRQTARQGSCRQPDTFGELRIVQTCILDQAGNNPAIDPVESDGGLFHN